MTVDTSLLGWYNPAAEWNIRNDDGLFVRHYVDFICVDETADNQPRYHVGHYDRGGNLINTNVVEPEEIESELRSLKENGRATDRPWHI